jgi:hypothetical protein
MTPLSFERHPQQQEKLILNSVILPNKVDREGRGDDKYMISKNGAMDSLMECDEEPAHNDNQHVAFEFNQYTNKIITHVM